MECLFGKLLKPGEVCYSLGVGSDPWRPHFFADVFDQIPRSDRPFSKWRTWFGGLKPLKGRQWLNKYRINLFVAISPWIGNRPVKAVYKADCRG